MPNFRTPRIVGRVIKFLFALFILSVNAILIWRVFISTGMPKEIGTLLMNDRLSAAYEQYGDGLTFRRQEQATVTKAEYNYGYFSVTQCVFIPEAEQVQIVVRYNNSTLKHLAQDYGLAEIPSRDLTLFDVTLVKTTDLTPNDKSDNTDPTRLSVERYYPSEEFLRDTTTLYTFYRYVFDGVTVDDVTDGVFADIYYVDDIDYNERAYGTLCLYSAVDEWEPYQLTSADRKALRASCP